MRIRSLPLLVVALLAIGAGCANPEYDADDVRSELIDVGLTPEQASCVTSGLEARLLERALDAHRAPTEREREIAQEVLEDCDVEATTDAAGSS